MGIPSNGKKVIQKLADKFPGVDTQNLPIEDNTSRYFYMAPKPQPGVPKPLTPYLAIRFRNLVNVRTSTRLIHLWDQMLQNNIKFPHSDQNRSATPALHLGVWELCDKTPRLTADTRTQSKTVQDIIDRFLDTIRVEIAPKILTLLKEYCPEQYKRQLQ